MRPELRSKAAVQGRHLFRTGWRNYGKPAVARNAWFSPCTNLQPVSLRLAKHQVNISTLGGSNGQQCGCAERIRISDPDAVAYKLHPARMSTSYYAFGVAP